MPEVAYNEIQDMFSNTPAAPGVPSSMSVQDIDKLGRSNPIQYKEPKPPVSLLERGKEDIEKPFVQLQHTIGATTSWLGDNIKDQTPFGDLGSRVTRAGMILQERSEKSLREKFSNFTPNMLDDLIGAAPTIAGYMGLAALSSSAIATGAIAGAAGLGIAAEEFGKFKSQGRTTPEANALATAIGAPAGGVMALGFGKVGELVEPWFTKMLGATISKIAQTATAGGVGLAAQAGTVDTAEFATGAEPFKGKESVVKTLTDIAHNAIFGTILGGGMGLHYGLAQHGEFIKGLKDLGLNDKQAQETASDVLGQGSHALMDALEKNLEYSKDETSRIQAPPAKGEVRPNVLNKSGSGIPDELNYPSIEPLPQDAESVTDLSKDFKYVKLEPLNLTLSLSAKVTADDIRSKFAGGRDKQWARGVYLNQDIKTSVVDGVERQGMFWMVRSKEFLNKALTDPQSAAKEILTELNELKGKKDAAISEDDISDLSKKLIQLTPELEKAISPSKEMLAALAEGKQYYEEAGIVSKAFGTIDEIRENYHSSRLYKPEPLSDHVKQLTSVTKRFSAHGLQRYYPDPFLAIADGKEFHTTDYADNLLTHNQEVTAVNYARQMMDAMSNLKPIPLGLWIREGALPQGWQQIGTMKKLSLLHDPQTGEPLLDENKNQLRYNRIFAAPKGIADGLRPLTDPNYMKLIPGWKTANTVQGIAKTGILSFSFFHHYTFAAQTMASLDGWRTLSDIPNVLKNNLMNDPVFRQQELRFLGANGSTTVTHAVQDVLRDINKGDDIFSKVLKAPVAKELNQISEANTKLLFDGMQRYIKVTTFSKNMALWEGKNPRATADELREAELGYAKATNAEFGGLNWEALGVNRTSQALMRFFLLAPDWVVSNLLATKYAFSDLGPAGSQARWTLGSAVLGGLVLNNALNYMRTGHSTFENKKGHELEAEVSPDVYVNSIRGAPGELMKLGTDMIESEGAPGFARYAEGKLSPMVSAGITATSGVNYFGGNIWKGDSALEKNVNGFWNILTHITPAPIGLTGAVNYGQREDDKSPLGWGLISTGLGRFSKSSDNMNKADMDTRVIQAFRSGNTELVDHLINKGDLSEEQAAKLKEESEKPDNIRHLEKMKIDRALQYYQQSKPEDRRGMDEIIGEKYNRFQSSNASPNEKKRIEKLYSKIINQ